ncbi:methyl-accepting chemotaxis protein [Paraburkholderia podalyriae]|uniref:methyl-accepting chemotaxis protein n=1 Tax=Paraburkholderia TaxID=1822464 RepID=UPI001FE403E5|nr:methyl-accepting chemotaxis protein [Paraburkholderia podalyriae]
MTVIAITRVESVRQRLDQIIDVNGVKERYAINFRGSVHDRSIAVRDVTLVSHDELPAVVAHIRQLAADYDEAAKPLAAVYAQRTDISPAERVIYSRVIDAGNKATPFIDEVIARQTSGDTEGARTLLLQQARPALVEWLAAINQLIDFQEVLNRQGGAEARQISVDFRWMMLALTGLACVIGVGVAVLVVRNIGRSLGAEPRELIAFADAIRRGDLSQRAGLRTGDTGSVMATVVRMREALADIVGQVRVGADAVAGMSHAIAAGNADLGARTELQASALEQATGALKEFDASVATNTANAGHADELARHASETAGQGGMAVGRVVETMHGIRASSARIAEIISVIDGIAFQTNILALNAAVEAARAGSQGRGFAVVAGEVRLLAQRSAEAAKEVRQLIVASDARVKDGATQVDDAGSTISAVVDSSARVTGIMSEIHDACQQQTLHIGEVREMIASLEHGTQQNVALVQQSGAAADALNRQAQTLLGAVNLFSVDVERDPELKSAGPQQRDATARNPALSLTSSYS